METAVWWRDTPLVSPPLHNNNRLRNHQQESSHGGCLDNAPRSWSSSPYAFGKAEREVCSGQCCQQQTRLRRPTTGNNDATAGRRRQPGSPVSRGSSSAAAAFFARAAQRMTTVAASRDVGSSFSDAIKRSPPPVPAALLRRLDAKDAPGVGKVKVALRVREDCGASGKDGRILNVDSRRRQVALSPPKVDSVQEQRKSAPRMFAFDAIFDGDSTQSDVNSSALCDVIHSVINGSDGCVFCFGHSRLDKSGTMLGNPESCGSLGVIPCAIAWLFRAIAEQKQRTGARFSVRVSAVEGSAASVTDLLAAHANECEQTPGQLLRDGAHSELRAPTADHAAFYLDAALNTARSTAPDSALLYRLHVYQHRVAARGQVVGGRSRLHLIDLGSCDRLKTKEGIPLSGIGNILLAIFNGQKHLPHREHKVAQLLRDCLGSLTCHAAMLVHVCACAEHYSDTLTTLQLAARIHRMRHRKSKLGGGTASRGVWDGASRTGKGTSSSSELDPSSSEQSADTVIYVGRVGDDSAPTDGEHPPVYQRHRSPPAGQDTKVHVPVSTPTPAPAPPPLRTDEMWVDGPRLPKAALEQSRLSAGQETWVDGPGTPLRYYGYMDSHKKNMIRDWVENQRVQVHERPPAIGEPQPSVVVEGQWRGWSGEDLKVLHRCGVHANGYGSPERAAALKAGEQQQPDLPIAARKVEGKEYEVKADLESRAPVPVHCRRTDTPSYELEEANLTESDHNKRISGEGQEDKDADEDYSPDPVPMQDSCIQVTEEDIAQSMADTHSNDVKETEGEEHPLRVLSQENLTVVSTFADTISLTSDTDRNDLLQHGEFSSPSRFRHVLKFNSVKRNNHFLNQSVDSKSTIFSSSDRTFTSPDQAFTSTAKDQELMVQALENSRHCRTKPAFNCNIASLRQPDGASNPSVEDRGSPSEIAEVAKRREQRHGRELPAEIHRSPMTGKFQRLEQRFLERGSRDRKGEKTPPVEVYGEEQVRRLEPRWTEMLSLREERSDLERELADVQALLLPRDNRRLGQGSCERTGGPPTPGPRGRAQSGNGNPASPDCGGPDAAADGHVLPANQPHRSWRQRLKQTATALCSMKLNCKCG